MMPLVDRVFAFSRDFTGLFVLSVDSLVLPTIVKKLLNFEANSAPFCARNSNDSSQPNIVIRQRANRPIFDNEKEIGTMLEGGELASVLEIISDVERHPRTIAHDCALF